MNNDFAEQFNSATTAADFLAIWLNHPFLSEVNQKILDDYYRNFRKFGSPRMRYWYNQQVAEAETMVRGTPGLRVLEVGVGTGTEFLWWGMLGADVTGIDAFQHCVAVTAERLDVLQRTIGRKLKCSLQTAQIIDFNDDAGFDLIWMEQAFHHLEPRAEVLKQIAKLLRPGGSVVFSEANALNPLLQLQLLRVRGLKMFVTIETDRGKVVWGNERVLSRGSLKRLLRKEGLEQVSSRYYRVFPARPMFEPLFGLERRLSSSWLAPMFTHYNLVARKAV
jgi:2-polyprenyl-3-methyl-5-hydroxy-6-metoxy-1,4-benzoquinol methylase